MAESYKPRSHVARPSVFNGDNTKFRSFMRSCNLYIAGNHREFPEDQDKIIFVLSHMKEGVADIWAENYQDKAVADSDYGKWEDFKAALETSFADPNLTKHAVDKLETITQGTLTADAFFQTFEMY